MICVGIDVAKDKHDCFIMNSEGEVLYDVFTVQTVKRDLKLCFNQSLHVQVTAKK